MKPNKLDLSSVDGTKLNLEALYQIAPSCFTEVKDDKTGELRHVVNFKTLRQLLGDNAVEDADEMYQFTWPGKQEARREAARPSTKTLRPVVEDSVDWDNTQNLYIEGDNLEVLKLLQKSYMGKVKMIYIDPPYNTGNDFVYDDDFVVSQDDYDLFSGDVDDLGNRYRKNTDSNGRFHSDWCSMMYSRLMVARSLLTEDGVIFISIDDNEVENLKKICNEIFGEGNGIGLVTRIAKTTSFRGNYLAPSKDYILIYAKNINFTLQFKDEINNTEQFNKIETEGNRKGEFYRDDIAFYLSTLETRPNQRYFIECPDGELVLPPGETIPTLMRDGIKVYPIDGDGVWRWEREQYLLKKDLLSFKKTKTSPLINQYGEKAHWNIYTKSYLNDKKEKGNIPRDVFEGFLNRNGSEDLKRINIPFPFPKPIRLIKYIMSIANIDDNSIIIDFFSGSATTAHAVMQLNAEDSGNRKYIMVQLPEETPEDSEARKAGYNTIPEIAKERIRRAGKKIKEENKDKEGIETLDTGFRVFRLADSNFEEVKKAPAEYDQSQLDLFLDNVKSDRTDLDLLFGAMLSWGVQLSLPMTSEEVDGKMVYSVNDGDLVACFADDITENIVKAMADKQPLRVLFRDSCFARDDAKINVFETLKQLLDWSEEEAMKNIKVI